MELGAQAGKLGRFELTRRGKGRETYSHFAVPPPDDMRIGHYFRDLVKQPDSKGHTDVGKQPQAGPAFRTIVNYTVNEKFVRRIENYSGPQARAPPKLGASLARQRRFNREIGDAMRRRAGSVRVNFDRMKNRTARI